MYEVNVSFIIRQQLWFYEKFDFTSDALKKETEKKK